MPGDEEGPRAAGWMLPWLVRQQSALPCCANGSCCALTLTLVPPCCQGPALGLSSCHFALVLLKNSGQLLENHNRCCLA